MHIFNNDILLLAHSLKEYVVGLEGNVSKKTKDGFLIKASGTSLKNLSNKDLVKCDFKGNQINNFNKKPSIETKFHSLLLEKSNINFIAHTHPKNTLKILCSDLEIINEFAEKRIFPDQIVFNGLKSCVVPYVHPGEELCEKIESSVDQFIKTNQYFPKLILLINHGIICTGFSTKECLISTEMCEKSAEIFIGMKQLGFCKFMTDEEAEKVVFDKKEIYRQKNIM